MVYANSRQDEYEQALAAQQKQDDKMATEDHKGPTNKEAVNIETISNSQADSIFGIITDLKEAGALAKRQLNLDLVVSTLQRRFDVASEDYARDLIAARSAQVIERMDESDFEWQKKAIYRDLKQIEEKAEVRHVAITPLRPRTSLDESTSSSEHGDGNEEEDEDDSPRARRHRMRMSVLRPSTTKAGKKTRGGKFPGAVKDDAHLSDDSDVAEDVETPSKSRGLNLVRDPPPSVTTLNGRARSILSDADSTSLVIRKTPLQETRQSANLSGPDTSSFNHEDSSIITDDLPEDTWACSVEGCGKVIYKASSKRSKELISDHTLMHAEDTQTKLDLVFAEQRLNIGLGVDNLLRRIREFGTLDEINGDDADGAAKRVRR